MRMTRERKNLGVRIVLAALSVWSMAVYAQSSQTGDGAWQWSAELVSFDEATRMLTVKAMAVGDAARQVSAVKSGEKVMITWSGFDKYASAVNGVVKPDATKKLETRFAFPAEFVAFDAERNYITFKASVPADSVSRIKALKTGQWVTATSKPASQDRKSVV